MTRKALKWLENIQFNIQTTIYLPIVSGPEGTAKNISTLHHAIALLKKAQLDAGVPKQSREIISEHVKNLETVVSQPMPGKSLAIFITKWNDIIYYLVPFETSTAIYFMAPNLQLEPLSQYYKSLSPYWVLAISQKGCQLFKGIGETIRHIDAQDMAIDLKTALGLDELSDSSVQSHTVASGLHRTSEGFHGHGGFKDVRKKYLENYMRYIDSRLAHYIGHKDSPIYLVGVQRSQDMYRKVSSSHRVIKTKIHSVHDAHNSILSRYKSDLKTA